MKATRPEELHHLCLEVAAVGGFLADGRERPGEREQPGQQRDVALQVLEPERREPLAAERERNAGECLARAPL